MLCSNKCQSPFHCFPFATGSIDLFFSVSLAQADENASEAAASERDIGWFVRLIDVDSSEIGHWFILLMEEIRPPGISKTL